MSLQAAGSVVDMYPYRESAGRREWLLLRRAAGVAYAGTWRMVGGKVGAGEPAWKAALRELREETGLYASVAWTIPSPNVFYEWQTDRIVVAPAFAARVAGDPFLDREHDAWRWAPAEDARRLLAWPEQRRLLRLAETLLGEGALAPEWRLPV